MAWSDTMNWRDGRWWVTFQNEAVRMNSSLRCFMRFGVVGYAAEELRVRSEPAAEESGSLSRAKSPSPYRESSERGRAARKRGSGYPHALDRMPCDFCSAMTAG